LVILGALAIGLSHLIVVFAKRCEKLSIEHITC
jgi:hypothetical protein